MTDHLTLGAVSNQAPDGTMADSWQLHVDFVDGTHSVVSMSVWK